MIPPLSRRSLLSAIGAASIATPARAAGPPRYDIDARLVLGGPKPRLVRDAVREIANGDAVEMLSLRSDRATPLMAAVIRRGPRAPVFLLCPGNGYAASTALPRLAAAPALSAWSIAVVDYWSDGDPPPTIAAIRTSLHNGLPAIRGDAAKMVVAGHSLGCWFAADLAATRRPRDRTLLVAPGTTVEAVVRNMVDVTPGRRLRIDPDLAALDMVRMAAHVRTATAIIASERDAMMPAAFAQTVYAALPAARRSGLLILPDVDHGAFFADPRTWAFIDHQIHEESA